MPRRDDWKANVGAGQRRAWSDPEVHRRRSEAIRAAWDDPLRRALMRAAKETQPRKPTGQFQ